MQIDSEADVTVKGEITQNRGLEMFNVFDKCSFLRSHCNITPVCNHTAIKHGLQQWEINKWGSQKFHLPLFS